MKSSFLGTSLFAFTALLAANVARADSTTVTSDTWTVIYDADGNPVPGLNVKFCYTLYFNSSQSAEYCTDDLIGTDNGGQIKLTGVVTIQKYGIWPRSYVPSLKINGVKYFGHVPTIEKTYEIGDSTLIKHYPAMWDAQCKDVTIRWVGDGMIGHYVHVPPERTCYQMVHFEFHLPLHGAELVR